MTRLLGTSLLALSTVAPSLSHALPVIPNLSGFGTDTPAGRGGKVYRVTNLNTSGSGSLKECIAASGPRVCVFEVSGIIRAHDDLIIWNPYITIAGQTAPSPGIEYVGGALGVATHDVLIQHIRVRAGDDPNGPSFENRDALRVGSTDNSAKNVVIDHCSFSWGTDENVDFYMGLDNVTLTNSIISEGLHESFNPLGFAGYGLIVGPINAKVNITGNLFAHNQARNILSRGAQTVFVKNVVYNRATGDVDLQGEKGREVVANTTVIGNVFLRGPSWQSGYRPLHIFATGDLVPTPGSKIYVADNKALEASDDPWSIGANSQGQPIPSEFRSGVLPAWPAGMTRLATGDNAVLNNVLRYSGARPADRDPVDKRVIASVTKKTGQIINCVASDGTTRCSKNAGGWPSLPTNTRKLTLPSNPNTVTPSGYTNLEVWLHQMSATVEGRSPTPPPPPSLAVR
jgi:hypothetical protein